MGQDAVGAVKQVQPVVIVAGEPDLGAIGLELDGGQEGLFGVFFAVGDAWVPSPRVIGICWSQDRPSSGNAAKIWAMAWSST